MESPGKLLWEAFNKHSQMANSLCDYKDGKEVWLDGQWDLDLVAQEFLSLTFDNDKE